MICQQFLLWRLICIIQEYMICTNRSIRFELTSYVVSWCDMILLHIFIIHNFAIFSMWHDDMISWCHNMTCTYMHGRCRKRCDHCFSGLPKVAFLSLHFLRRDSGHFAMTHWVPKWQRQTPALWMLLVPMPLHGANGFDYDEGTCCMYHQVGLRCLHTVILETKALKQKLAKITTCWPLKRCLCQDGLQFF